MAFTGLKDLQPVYRLLEVTSVLTLLVILTLCALFFPELPDSIPVHFTMNGNADDWGDKRAFLAFPALSLVFYFLFSYLASFPEKFSFPNGTDLEEKRVYTMAMLRWIKAEILLLLLYIEITIIMNPDGKAGFMYGFPAFGGALVLTLGFFLYKGYRIKQDGEEQK